jgi:hypothetical protein
MKSITKEAKQEYNATYRARYFGYALDSENKIAFIEKDDLREWQNTEVHPAIKFLQENFNWRVVMR